ncbi:MAG: hypothetical protein GY859_06450, partial [Desulfobacterales bacterium]|nr:hypothetical protein [Desulfobacterales bacterium]
ALLTGLFSPGWCEDDFSDLVIFATNSVYIKRGVNVDSGDVVVNGASDGPTLDGGVALSVDKDGIFAGDLKADSIILDKNVAVGGDVLCNNELGATCDDVLDLPVFDNPPPFREAVGRAGAADVAVGPGETVTLDPGAYADITVNKGGSVVFTGGIYDIGSIISVDAGGGRCGHAPCRSLLFEAPADLRILGVFNMGGDSYIGLADGVPAAASDIIFYVGGANMAPDDPGSEPTAVSIGKDSGVAANILAANGTLWIRKNARITGARLIGASVSRWDDLKNRPYWEGLYNVQTIF